MKKFSAFLIGAFAFAAVAQTPATTHAPVTAQANPAKRAGDDTASSEKSHSANKAAKTLSKKIGLPTFWRPADLRWSVPVVPTRTTPRETSETILI